MSEAAVATVRPRQESTRFNPRTLVLEYRYRREDGLHECRVAKFGPWDGRQPFHGTWSLAGSKGQAREHIWQALRIFSENEAKSSG